MAQKISLFSNKFPNRFVIDRQGLVDIDVVETHQDRLDASWEWTGANLVVGPGGAPAQGFGQKGRLRRAGFISGNFWLTIADFDGNRIHSKFIDEAIVDPDVVEEVRQNSTFILEKGLIDPNHVSFRSARFPDLVIQQVNFQLFAKPARPQFPEEFQAATFRIVQPALDASNE
ncbi:AbfB domain-containing protein [Mycolicibacterium houstonense]|uniref:AbfB domain-containing protein n=1 Tax=Mycolicibacterium houstonense TaxID=146021 RepID=UPI0008340C66|nr:AbfB domain-containing protein [Mycolicibacterium houstonense]